MVRVIDCPTHCQKGTNWVANLCIFNCIILHFSIAKYNCTLFSAKENKMDQYNITDSDVKDVLALHGLSAVSLNKMPKSGQRQVFEVTFDSEKTSILKFVDVSPYHAYQRYKWNEFPESELEHEKAD